MSQTQGLTRSELAVGLAIVVVVLAIGIDAYRQHVLRSRIEPVVAALAAAADGMREHYRQHATYAGGPCPADTREFTMRCWQPPPDREQFRIEARGRGEFAAFSYRVDQSGRRESQTVWQDVQPCWIVARGGAC